MATSYTDGIKTFDGEPIIYRDSHTAELNFGLSSEAFTAIPSYKFLYYVRFISSVASSDTTASSILTSNGASNNSFISFAVKNMTRPGVTMSTRTLNQYNKHRVVQTRTEYDPVTINFHDTVDNRIFQLFKSYFEHYYKDSLNSEYSQWYNDVIAASFNQANGWGYSPTFTNQSDIYYFDKIEIYKMYGGYYTMQSLIHPFITKFSPDNFDYADSGGVNQVAMSFVYEGITYDVQNPTLLPQELIAEMGLDQSSYYEPYDSEVSNMTFGQYTSEDLYGNSSDLNIGGQLSTFFGGTLQTVLNEAMSGQKVSIGSALKGNLLSTIGNNINNTSGTIFYQGLSGLLNGESGSTILGNYGFNMLNSGIINTEHNSLNNNYSLKGLNLYT